jgi:N-acetylmuramoyl-L-alanine amidase
MTLSRLFIAPICVALACAGTASAAVSLEARDVPLPASASARGASARLVLPAQTAPLRFNLVGLHWRGPGDVWFRTSPTGGRWSAWHAAGGEGDDAPDTGSAEARPLRAWTLGDPYWTGAARRIQYRVEGSVTRLRAYFLWSPVRAAPPARTVATTTRPAIITRAGWNANESIVRSSPSYAPRLGFAVVHHTAGGVPTSAARSAAMVRAIQSYHVRSNGWNDIGYNFLVDPFGQIFEGRGGGMTRNVIGAHAQGFNTGSVGVSVLGSYGSTAPSAAAQAAIARLLAWRLDLAHVDPTSSVTWTSLGSPTFPAGTPVLVAAVSGHGQLGATACPGAKLLSKLPAIAATTLALGGPKLFSPGTQGTLGGPIRFTGRLSTPLAWTVRVLDGAGVEVASGSGTGKLVAWTWNSSVAPPGAYSYVMEAEGGVRPATARVPGEPPLTLAPFAPSPPVLTPNADAIGDIVQLPVSVSKSAALALRLETTAGVPVATIIAARALARGTTTISWRGRSGGAQVADGRYRLVAQVTAGAEQVTRRADLTIDRTLGRLTVTPSLFSPNGDGRLETVEVGLTLARTAAVRLRVLAGTTPIATLFSGSAGSGRRTFTWNGKGAAVDGALRVVAEATTSLGTRRLEGVLVRDTTKPRVTILEARRRAGGGTYVRLRLSEAALLVLRFDDETVRRSYGPGEVVFRRSRASRSVSVYALDAAANGRTVFARIS